MRELPKPTQAPSCPWSYLRYQEAVSCSLGPTDGSPGSMQTQCPPLTRPRSPCPIHQRPRLSGSGSSKFEYQFTPIVTGTGFDGVVDAVSGQLVTCDQESGMCRSSRGSSGSLLMG